MKMIPASLSRRIFYPLWDLYDRSSKLWEYRRMLKSQWRRPVEIESEQRRKLSAIVDYAVRHCPYYSQSKYSIFKSSADFYRLPLLQKSDLRQFAAEMVSRKFALDSLSTAKTGGSTGTSVTVRFDKKCRESRNAAALRSDGWAGWRPGDVRGALWGNPPEAKTWREKIRSACLDRIVYLDTLHMTDAAMGRFVEELRRLRVRVLFGHAHSLFILARFVEENKSSLGRMRGIISTSMMLLPHERQVIERVLGPVTNRYGCEEVGLIASECERHQGLHVNADHVFVEILKDDGSPAAPGEEGRIVVTDLVNRGMPLIRYAVGDVGIRSVRICACGRGLPLLEKVVGRTADFLVTPDGSLVAGVSLVERTLTAIPGIAQLQVVQNEPNELQLNVVPDAEYSLASERLLVDEFKAVFGPETRVRVNRTDGLEMEKNGKYRFSICRVPSRYQRSAEALMGGARW